MLCRQWLIVYRGGFSISCDKENFQVFLKVKKSLCYTAEIFTSYLNIVEDGRPLFVLCRVNKNKFFKYKKL